ncbi:MAG: energy transducer TonB [Candidatus Zixiibacteriota bacterium]
MALSIIVMSIIVISGNIFGADDEFIPVDQMPVMIYQEIPAYPMQAEKDSIAAKVCVKAYVDNDGTVGEVLILKSDRADYGFEESAMAAAYKCKYSPALQNNQPVATWVSYCVNFKIEAK